MKFQSNIVQYQQKIDSKLKKYLLKSSSHSSDKLNQAIMYSVLNGGKRLRPLLVYGVGNLFHSNQRALDNTAMAVEFIHTFSLIHDDLPSMDNDSYRRGKLSCHKKFDESTAILAGDALQSLGFEVLSENNHVEQIKLLARAIGKEGMALGQVQDMIYQEKLNSKNFSISKKKLYEMHHLKTGKLISASIVLGAMCHTASPSQTIINKLRMFGEYFGLGFQLLDDYLDKENSVKIETVINVFDKATAILKWFENNEYPTQLLMNIIEYLLCQEKN